MKVIFIIAVSIFLIACTKYPKRIVKKFSDGYLVSIYDRQGHVLDSEFDNTQKLTRTVTYFPGSTQQKRQIVDFGKNHASLSKEFFPNGALKKKMKIFGSDRPSETFEYSVNSKLIEYTFSDSAERKVYIRMYDEKGKLIKEVGSFFFVSYINSSKNIFLEKDTVKARFYAPSPPDCKTTFYTVQQDKPYNNIYETDRSVYGVDIFPLKKGKYEWQVYAELMGTQSGEVIKSPLQKIIYIVN